jgi:hypothetical protein
MWEEDALGYLATAGQLDTRHKGLVMMMTQPVSDTAETTVAEGFTRVVNWASTADTTNSTDYTISWGSDGLRKRTQAGVWSEETKADGSTGADLHFVLETNNYIHTFYDGARIERYRKEGAPASDTTQAGQWVDGGANTDAEDFRYAAMHEGRIFAVKDGASQIHHSANETLEDLEGAVTDPNVILIGGDWPVISLKAYLGKLLAARYDGLFQVDATAGSGGGGSARRLLDFTSQASSTNFRFMEVFNNKLVFPIRDTIYMWNGATLSDISPPFLSDSFPFKTYGRFDNGVTIGRFLFMTARTNEASYEEHLLAWDGVGWHMLGELVTAGDGSVTGVGFDEINNYLWYSLNQPIAGNSVNYIEFQDLSEFSYANYSTSGTHRLTSSRMGMGFRRVTKSSPSLIVEASNVTAARYLEVHYQLDGGTIFEWGGAADGTGSTACRITSNGVTTLTNPTGDADGLGTLEYNYMQIHIDFVTDATGKSPILEGYTLRFIMRPQTLYGHFFNVIAASNLKVGMSRRDLKSVRDIYSGIDTARSSAAPVSFTDPFGVTVQGYISSIERRAVERHGRTNREGFPNIESRILVNFVEVG